MTIIAGSEFDRTVYEHGFRYYCFENDAMHDMQSQIMMYNFQNTPEKLLLRFCERAKVIGISATATVPTVIGNFDMDYLRSKMQGAFYQMPQAEYQRIGQDFRNSQTGYQHIRIHTELLGAANYSPQTWIYVFNNKELAEQVYYKLEREVRENYQNSYNKERYARIAMAFKAFLQHSDIRSMLCLLTKHPAKNDCILNTELITYILNLIAGLRPDQKNPYLEYLKGDDYDIQKDSILNRLANGEKLFVISTYQTIGAGQHIRKAFRCYVSGKKPNEYVENVYNKQSVRMYATRVVIQAIGRICRTNQKNSDIYIFADDRIAESLDLTVSQGRILNHEFISFIEKIRGTQQKTPAPSSLADKAELVSNRAGRYIDNMLQDGWTESKIKQWQELRQLVLRYPTVSEQEAENNFIFPNYYVKLPQASNMLYYRQENDFRKISVSFTRSQTVHSVEDESETRLDRLMKWDSLRNYFQEHDYATYFKPDDYIMSPPVWNNIYKGVLGETAGKFWFSQVLGIQC